MKHDINILPVDVEWPRFEDGELVRIGDELMTSDGVVKVEELSLTICDTEGGVTTVPFGEYVKRPPILAADGVPLEVGQTLYRTTDGMEEEIVKLRPPTGFIAKGGIGFEASRFTHQRPVFDSDNVPINAGDTVWHIKGAGPFKVRDVSANNVNIDTNYPCEVKKWNYKPRSLTHERPVLDAYGVPIHEGDTVWRLTDGKKFEVTGIDHQIRYVRIKDDNMELGIWVVACGFTHTKPEPPDSWELIERDCYMKADEYARKRMGIDPKSVPPKESRRIDMACDLVRRCKKLTGVSE